VAGDRQVYFLLTIVGVSTFGYKSPHWSGQQSVSRFGTQHQRPVQDVL